MPLGATPMIWAIDTVEKDVAANHGWIAAKMLPPVSVAQHNHAVLSKISFCGSKEAAKRWLHTQSVKHVGADRAAEGAVGSTGRSNVVLRVERVAGYRFEGLCPALVLRRIQPLGKLAKSVCASICTSRFAFAKWQGLQHDGIKNAENGGIRPNAEGQRHDRDGREASISNELSQGVAKILE